MYSLIIWTNNFYTLRNSGNFDVSQWILCSNIKCPGSRQMIGSSIVKSKVIMIATYWIGLRLRHCPSYISYKLWEFEINSFIPYWTCRIWRKERSEFVVSMTTIYCPGIKIRRISNYWGFTYCVWISVTVTISCNLNLNDIRKDWFYCCTGASCTCHLYPEISCVRSVKSFCVYNEFSSIKNIRRVSVAYCDFSVQSFTYSLFFSSKNGKGSSDIWIICRWTYLAVCIEISIVAFWSGINKIRFYELRYTGTKLCSSPILIIARICNNIINISLHSMK